MSIYDFLFQHLIKSDATPVQVSSFLYNGRKISLQLSGMQVISSREQAGQVIEKVFLSVLNQNLEVRLHMRVFEGSGAADWFLVFSGCGSENTFNISGIHAMDIMLPSTGQEHLAWHSITGDRCDEDSFMPIKQEINGNGSIIISPVGGRPSNGSFPFFNIVGAREGMVCAIGWSGQWQYKIERTGSGCRITAGLQDADFYLKPGETARSPRILAMPWAGNEEMAYNHFRRLMREYFSPKTRFGDGFKLPAALQDWCRYVFFGKDHPDWDTEEGQIRGAGLAKSLEYLDAFWMDAMWFDGEFPKGVGNYRFAQGYPRGLKPIADAVHRNGLKYIVWFEPERASEGTDVYEKCDPSWLIELTGHDEAWEDTLGKAGMQKLVDLSNPEARTWLTLRISDFIEQYGIDIYRQDFNMDPLEFWRSADEAGRKGLKEIKYVEGFYRFWDDLLARFPRLLIDNCASGGRRIDLETCMRSVTLWRSDTGSAPRTAEKPKDLWNQNQVLGLSRYLPYHSVNNWSVVPYEFRSAMTMGIVAEFDVLSDSFDKAAAMALLAEFRRLQKFWSGDFYGLTGACLDKTTWSAYQLDSREIDSGAAIFFRRDDSPYSRAVFALKGIVPEHRYKIVMTDENLASKEQMVEGKALAEGIEWIIPARKESLVVEYMPFDMP